jgi:hypothetical protein
MTTIEFRYGPLDRVLVKEVNRPGVVDAVCMDIQGQMFKVVYWYDGERRAEYMHDWELEPIKG